MHMTVQRNVSNGTNARGMEQTPTWPWRYLAVHGVPIWGGERKKISPRESGLGPQHSETHDPVCLSQDWDSYNLFSSCGSSALHTAPVKLVNFFGNRYLLKYAVSGLLKVFYLQQKLFWMQQSNKGGKEGRRSYLYFGIFGTQAFRVLFQNNISFGSILES